MLKDPFGRTLDYLRVSVTDKCNYRCTYCMPAEGITHKSHDDMLRYESIALIAGVAGKLGFKKIRLTGGEPLVKKDIESLVKMIHLTKRYDEITMTTNGVYLTPQKALNLKENGLTRVNISLDTLDPLLFSKLTRGGSLNDVFLGIKAAKKAELFPIKINMIIFEETTKNDVREMERFCQAEGLTLQTIKHFALYQKKDNTSSEHVFDRPLPCELCNRLRLTADGYLKPCLFSNREIKVDLNAIEQSIVKAIAIKSQYGTGCANRFMCQIGG